MVAINNSYKSHAAMLLSSILFGFNYFLAKSLMPDVFSPPEIIFLRLLVSAPLFWLIAPYFSKEKVLKSDLLLLALCSILGVAANQIMFIEGLNRTSPVNASFIHLINPVFVLIFAAFIINEKITSKRIAGIVLGIIGTAILITYEKKITIGNDSFFGNMLIIANTTIYALYVVLIKPLLAKYNPFTILKWVFLFGFIFSLTYTFDKLSLIPQRWIASSSEMKLVLIYVVLITTFFCYILITIGMRHLDATVASYYVYIQPVITVIIAIVLGTEKISLIKILSSVLIFIGVYLVSGKSQKRDVLSFRGFFKKFAGG